MNLIALFSIIISYVIVSHILTIVVLTSFRQSMPVVSALLNFKV